MNLLEKHVEFCGVMLTLTNQRAVYWASQECLILSDIHIGKTGHFRKHGIAIPQQVSEKDLQRLAGLLAYYRPRRLIIVGDLVHAAANREMDRFRTLREQFIATKFVLIKGNHDRFSDELLHALGIDEVYDELHLSGVLLSHEPSEELVGPTISGHIHPGFTVKLAIKKSITLPCFVVGRRQFILPAFSEFTGFDTQLGFVSDPKFFIFEDSFLEEFRP